MSDNSDNTEITVEDYICETESEYSTITLEEDGIQVDDTEYGLVEELHNLFSRACKLGNVAGLLSLTQQQLNSVAFRANKNGQSVMATACASGALQIVRHLTLTTALDINAKDNDGNTPLMYAAQGGHFHIIRFLLWSFEDLEVDAENHKGMTALMKTALRGHSLCARILIVTGGADIEKRDRSRNFCAHQWALLCGFQETAKIISSVGSSGKRHVQKKVTSGRSQTKFDLARDAYRDLKRRIRRTLGFKEEFKPSEVGTLFYLVDSTTNPQNAMWPVAWSTFARSANLEKTHGEESDGQLTTTTGPPVPPSKSISRKVPTNAKDLPTIMCTFPSPVLERKKKSRSRRNSKSKVDDNFLKVPQKKAKHSK